MVALSRLPRAEREEVLDASVSPHRLSARLAAAVAALLKRDCAEGQYRVVPNTCTSRVHREARAALAAYTETIR